MYGETRAGVLLGIRLQGHLQTPGAGGHWSDTADHARERQRKHRLRENTRPREPATDFDDPLELADRALESLQRVRQALRSNVVGRQYLDDACELIRQLGWGPVSAADSRPAKPDPVFDLTTPAGRGRLGQHRRWHASGKRPCNGRPSPSA